MMNIISSTDPMAVDFVINEKQLVFYQKMLNNGVTEKDSIFHLILPDNTIYPYCGKISFIDRAVDPQTSTIKVRLIFSNKEKLLRAGMNCNVSILHANAEQQMIIPTKAMVEQMGEFFVFLVVENNKVKLTKITTGFKMKDKIIVRDGLKIGDQIVVEGVQKLRDGASILVK